MTDDVGYVDPGPEGKTCSLCANYEHDPENPHLVPQAGKCMGQDVVATASCNYFGQKQ